MVKAVRNHSATHTMVNCHLFSLFHPSMVELSELSYFIIHYSRSTRLVPDSSNHFVLGSDPSSDSSPREIMRPDNASRQSITPMVGTMMLVRFQTDLRT